MPPRKPNEANYYIDAGYDQNSRKDTIFSLNGGLNEEILTTGNLDVLREFLKNNVTSLSKDEREYLNLRIKSQEAFEREKTKQAAKLAAGEEKNYPEIKQEGNYMNLDLRYPGKQTSFNGCWSCSLSLMLKSRGVDLTQEQIRGWRPDYKANNGKSLASIQSMYERNADTSVAMENNADIVTDLLPNTSMKTLFFNPMDPDAFVFFNEQGKQIPATPEQKKIITDEIKAKTAQKLQEQICDAILVHHSPVALTIVNHTITVTGIDPMTGMLMVQDSLHDPTDDLVSIDSVVSECIEDEIVYDELGNLHFNKASGLAVTWLEDINVPMYEPRKENHMKVDFGIVSDCVTVDDEGKVGVQIPPNQDIFSDMERDIDGVVKSKHISANIMLDTTALTQKLGGKTPYAYGSPIQLTNATSFFPSKLHYKGDVREREKYLSGAKEQAKAIEDKGELFSLHSQFLVDRGYKVLLLDLRDTYSSSRWNPLGDIWDMYQEYASAGKGIIAHRDNMADYPDLKQMDGPAEEGALWAEWRGNAYADISHCVDDVSVKRQQIYDEMYEDLNDLVSVICPVENEKDPVWEKGARSIIMSTCLAMLEDSEDPRLGMTKEKFNFFNINKALTNSENEFATLKDYFNGRSKLSQAYTLSRQVMSAADTTLSSYMSITFDKLNMFNDRGLCGLTSATDVDAAGFAEHPTALFMKIPDEKDTRHGLAAVFILCMYKALIKVASSREDLSLPRNVYFILDEFGNMPKIEKFDKMITVGRSRKIWFNMVVQSYSQLSNVYGNEVADIVKSNCGMKMFIGSNDIGTCEEFSKLCGNMTVRTTSTSAGIGSKEGDINLSAQTQVRPLIYPSELQMLNNKESTGNAIIVTFGNYPLKTKYTPSYKCPYYKMGTMDMGELRSHMFKADEVYYDLDLRNEIVLGTGEGEDAEEEDE